MSQETKVYSFKGVGQTVDQAKESSVDSFKDQPFGIATPIRLAKKAGSLLEMHTDVALQVRDNFRNMLATNHGERLMLSDFGANLKPLAYTLGSESTDAEAIARISKTTQKYMPYITLETFEPLRELSTDGSLSRIGVRVTFSAVAVGISSQSVEVLISSAG